MATSSPIPGHLNRDRQGKTDGERRTLALEMIADHLAMIADQLTLIHSEFAQIRPASTGTNSEGDGATVCGNS